MTCNQQVRPRVVRAGWAVLAVLAGLVVVVGAVLLGVDSDQQRPAGAVREAPLLGDHAPALGEAGSVPDGGRRVFDNTSAAVVNLDPALLDALRRAAHDAVEDGVELRINSGWRSARYQEQLLRDAIAEYGSEAEAARWVARPETSAHVSGDAVDIGPSKAAAWLSQHGFEYGLCQIYENEPWHYELRPEAVGRGCPRMYADPTRDPRMQH